MNQRDRIEREIAIDALVSRVGELVHQPGWWVGDGDHWRHRRWRDGGTLRRVVESGFAKLIAARGLDASVVDGNVKGWAMQLDVARATTERVTA